MKGETCTQYLTLSSVLKPISSFSSGTDAAGYSSSDISACTKLAINAPKDGRGINQKQVLEQNLSSTDVHGRTSVERYMDV